MGSGKKGFYPKVMVYIYLKISNSPMFMKWKLFLIFMKKTYCVHFRDAWVPIFHAIISSGSVFTWDGILSLTLIRDV